MGILVDTKYDINHGDPNFVLGSDVALGTGDGVTWHEYGTYTVPDGVRLAFLPLSEFQTYLYDLEAAPAEMNAYTPVRIVHKDNTDQGNLKRLTGLYTNMKFSANVNEKKKIDEKFKAFAKEQLIIEVQVPSGSSMDVSSCKFSLTCRRIATMLTP